MPTPIIGREESMRSDCSVRRCNYRFNRIGALAKANTDLEASIAVLKIRVAKLEAALKWYAEKATAMARYMGDKKIAPAPESMVAVATELSLDNGNRAIDALKEDQ